MQENVIFKVKTMNINEINENSRRILIDVSQLYEAYLSTDSEYRGYRGTMRWKKVSGKEYLFRQRNSRGDGKSLGARDAQTQEIYDNPFGITCNLNLTGL